MSYTIGTTARLVGLTAPTLRCWESRYGWPKPMRDPTGARFYSITDIERIRRVIVQSKGKALQEVMEGISQQEENQERQLVGKYAVLVQRLQACLQSGPDHWYTEQARKEREQCLAEIRALALERSRLPR